jgi:hypothetical protein
MDRKDLILIIISIEIHRKTSTIDQYASMLLVSLVLALQE